MANTLPKYISQEDWDTHRQYIPLNTGVTLSYVEMGDPEGRPLILQHGTTDNSRIWSLTAPYFAEAGYHVYMTDLRGQGCSTAPDGFYTVVTYATDLGAFMDALGIEKAIMVGQSLGSLTMQAFMMIFPEKCDAVGLVSSAMLDGQFDTRVAKLYRIVAGLAADEHPSDAFINEWYTNANEVPEDFMAYIKKESQRLSAKAWKNVTAGSSVSDLTAMYPYFDSSIPTIIFHGAEDPMMPPESQPILRKCLPFADFVDYEGVGHNIHIEIPQRFANDLLAWLKSRGL